MKMFWKKRKNRRVFGFMCDEGLANGVKLTAKALGVPIFTLSEHALQIGMVQITPLLGDEEQRERLEHHLLVDHSLPPNLTRPVTSYDQEFLSAKKQDVIKNLIEEKKEDADVTDASKFFFALAKMCDVPPAYLLGFLQDLLLRNRYPKDWTTPYNPKRSDNYSRSVEQVNGNKELPDGDDQEEE